MKTFNTNTNVMEMFETGNVVKICAPMVRYSKLAFRSLVRKYKCDICFTPMIVAADFMRSEKARDSEFTTSKGDRPLIVQFAANDAQTLADAACVVAPFSDGVDLNCGCPQRWAMSSGYGACLINQPELVKDMVRTVRNQVDKPNYSVSIKIRIHNDIKKTVDLCQKAESAGVSWITVHGRTAQERHQPVHYDAIKTIKDSVSIPVIANGDIKYLRDVEATHKLTGVDGTKEKHPINMTLQWTAVAIFLYVEMGSLLILCIPFISPKRWRSIFHLRIWGFMSRFWNKVFLTMIIILIILFLDAVREVKKYSARDVGTNAKLQPNMYDHLHMKLFRAQRNLYISGFAVFLWLVMKRVITMISQLASMSDTTAALQAQADGANQVAKKYKEDNEQLKQSLMEGKGDKATEEGMDLLREELKKLKEELKASDETLTKSHSEADVMKKQMEGLAREYDRLLKEHQELQNREHSADKKSD
ncbi:tRNA-dihydrouridine(20a/20b) synthase [NAD(P)+]-like isoform X2 [Periophthalmus magnuspinnatus]|uniref:tRNA-dihydrouridine(20a/20b) synthase [NAD(P)+]-like isoform X2 n=1 Tax=Periophthalmus magnuspinnatus TaxID=409849 RepID=UPI00145AD108|nr:tRNA-dihydrouridine(20a/20b) synthase [NAD(P)+]-like isoform X2 [Periophthalmus magnuspinnatus]